MREAHLSSSVLSGPEDAPLARDARGYVHPTSEADLCALVRHARAYGMAVRVRGSGHSVPGAIHADSRIDTGRPAIEVVLDRYAKVSFDDERRQVTVQAGCRFGHDPHDPTGRASLEAGLCFQLERRGWALPNLGGVTHPTVAGFVSTGSAGASVQHSFASSVIALRIIDGRGHVRELSRESDGDVFAAALVSMGLFGIVSTVTLQAEAHYDVIGSELVTTVAKAPFDMFGRGPGSLEELLRTTQYARVLWWPQRGVEKVTVWRARRMEAEDYDDDTGPAWSLRRRPYHALDPILGSTVPLQAAAGAALAVLGGWQAALEALGGPMLGGLAAVVAQQAASAKLRALVTNAFVPESREPRRFWEPWWRGLAMDDQMDERLLPTSFTEVWVPLRVAGKALAALKRLFERDPSAAGHFVVEIYASGPGEAWLSPAGTEPALRLNFFWLLRNPEDPRDKHFPKLWEALEEFEPRLHWAKILPHDAAGSALRLAARYPRWKEFAKLRRDFDPDDLFLTKYWAAHLGLDEIARRPVAPLPGVRRHSRAKNELTKWPLLFDFGPADVSLFETATHLIDARHYIPAPIEEVAHIMWFEVTPEWLVAHLGLDWLTEENVPKDAVVDMAFTFMTMRGRVIELEWPNRWAAHITSSSLPLATSMIEGVELTRSADGGTDVRWKIAYEVAPALSPVNAIVKPFFQWMFQRSLENLARWVGEPGRRRTKVASGVAPRMAEMSR